MICGRPFKYTNSLRKHMKQHFGFALKKRKKQPPIREQNPPPMTDQIYCLNSQLTRHPCGYCGRSFSRPSSLAVHVRIHTGERPFSCDVCPAKFVTKSALVEHRTVHSGRDESLKCPFCDSTFTRKSSLSRHKTSIHGIGLRRIRPSLTCRFCGRNFNVRQNLARHEKTHQKTNSENWLHFPTEGINLQESDQFENGGQSVVYPSCFYRLTNRKGQKGVFPYNCQFCGKGFARASNWRRHVSTFPRKQYECGTCHLFFARAGALRNHEQRDHVY
ncbi:zinc finger protein 648-like [Octopus sinensis]|uniref:Zinc finger protein 648-like n=1 Tax=Octopus sinensis TaxID=2607531 RepID=A0A6P7U3Z7_9MOLL|nr:zinc finger protein 648-like [Octopus sinensis]